MAVRIIIRTGSYLPLANEYLEVGELIFDPDNNALGIGAGSHDVIYWLPGIDESNDDLVMHGSGMVRSQTGGKKGRFGWTAVDQFDIITTTGLAIKVNDTAITINKRLTVTNGGTLSGNFDTSEGVFTDINISELTISDITDTIAVKTFEGVTVGLIDSDGITSNSQSKSYAALAAASEGQASFLRAAFSSGLTGLRAAYWQKSFDPKFKASTTSFSALGIHSHPDWQNVCGLGEIGAVVNGYHIQTRHADYYMAKPISDETFGVREINAGPPVPSSVSSLPLGYTNLTLNNDLTGTQVEWMRNVYTNSPETCFFELTYLEVWLEVFNGNFVDMNTDINTTFTYSDVAERSLYYTRNGIVPPSQDLTGMNGLVATVDTSGHPVLAYVNWRISSVPVANLSTSVQEVTLDGYGYSLRALPFDPVKAAAGIVDGTNRFKLRRNLATRYTKKDVDFNSPDESNYLLDEAYKYDWIDIVNSDTRALFDCADLQLLCKNCPGFMGTGVFSNPLVTDPFGTITPGQGGHTKVSYSATDPRGLNYYSNDYHINTFDANGLDQTRRGLNDPNLFSAYCSFAENATGWSYMIPLELILRTPRETWNPFDIAYRSIVTGDGTSTTPYSGWNPYGIFYTLPYDSLIPATSIPTTQADTRTTAYMTTNLGTKEMYASGVNTFDYTGERRRFPVIPDAIQASSLGTDLNWLKRVIKRVLKKVAAGNITGDEIDDAW